MIISVLKNMDVRKLKKVRSVSFQMCKVPLDHPMSILPRLAALVWVNMKAFATEEDSYELGFNHEDRFINLRFDWEDSSSNDTETSEIEDGDEDGSDDEEETSDDGEEDEDGDEDVLETSEGAVEGSG